MKEKPLMSVMGSTVYPLGEQARRHPERIGTPPRFAFMHFDKLIK